MSKIQVHKETDRETGGWRDGEHAQYALHSFVAPSRCPSVSLSFFLFLFSWFAPLTIEAQTGEIRGRVVTEDGAGMPNVTVFLNPVASDRRPTLVEPF